ncbi:uncharacterized protein LOC143030757 isoform X1 [Oratosquilla oratoria]|uniref:uncharacterized protein LOC143030757 isoform X1 n=1 Tax=Oratosquilla oratoria TaxID=337810 RepID=UPI003F763EF4
MQVSLVITLALALCCAANTSLYRQCEGDGEWQDNCNWCSCKDGRRSCTRRLCTGPPELSHLCRGNVSWQIRWNCNWCSCDHGFPQCTDIRCAHRDESSQPLLCLQDLVQGPCEALAYKWGFNSSTSRCEEFEYGGCQGNENNFKTLDECVEVCE